MAEQHSYLLGAIELESVSGACEEGTQRLEPYVGANVSVFNSPEVNVTNNHNYSQQMGVLDWRQSYWMTGQSAWGRKVCKFDGVVYFGLFSS